MPPISSAPFVLRDVLLTLGADDYRAHVDRAAMVPSYNAVTWQGLTPTAVLADVSEPTWSLDLQGCQDEETASALSAYLFDHAGELVPVVFAPRDGVGRKYTGQVRIAPTTIGGNVSQPATFQVTLPMTGKPTPAEQV